MKKALKLILKRIFILFLVILAIYLIISNIDLIRDLADHEKINVLIDADAAHGVDDLLSILRLMADEEIEIRGLLSAQWRLADLNNDSTLALNSEINLFLLKQYHMTHIPHPEGSPLPIAYSEAEPASGQAATKAIVKAVQELPYGEKLQMLCLGSATNLAAAMLENPEISEKIICHIQGPLYNPSRRAWNKNDAVTRLDLEAMDVLLNEQTLELHLIPENVASEMVLSKSILLDEMSKKDTLVYFIRERLSRQTSESDSMMMGSLALVQAFLNPDLCTQKQLITPPENTQRKIYVYTRIDAERMQKDYFKTQPMFQAKLRADGR